MPMVKQGIPALPSGSLYQGENQKQHKIEKKLKALSEYEKDSINC